MNRLTFFLCILSFYNVYGDLNKSWWTKTSIYEIHPYSYKDSDGDGVGDIKGIISKLDYLQEIGIEVVYLSHFFESAGYWDNSAVVNHTNVDPVIGTIKDVEDLIEEMNAKDLKLVVDLSINHVHKNHIWFQKSVNATGPEKDYFLWRPSQTFFIHTPPNDWKTENGKTAWKWNCRRQKYFYHRFSPEQPDLNLRNENVKDEIKNIVKFWFDKGVTGFVLDSAAYYLEDKCFRNEYRNNPFMTTVIRTEDQDATYDFIGELRTFVDQYNEEAGGDERILIAESRPDTDITLKYYDDPGVHFVMNVAFANRVEERYGWLFGDTVADYLRGLPNQTSMSWMTESYRKEGRIPNRFDKESSDLYLITSMLAPGIVNVHYGQEIAMSESSIPTIWGPNQTVFYENIKALPMQWDDSENAGFTENRYPYQSINPDYWDVNVEKEQYKSRSHFNLFKRLMQLRKTKVIKHGDHGAYFMDTYTEAIIRRIGNERDAYITVINSGYATASIDLYDIFEGLPNTVKVAAASVNSEYSYGNRLRLNGSTFLMRPSSSIVLSVKMRRSSNEHDE